VRVSPFVLAVALLTAVTVSPAHVAAQEPTQNFELSLFPPVQLRGENSAIAILRLGLYNKIDFGEAFQFGIFNRARDISGCQLGIVNWAENMYRVQVMR
jgi:hypothetical protein